MGFPVHIYSTAKERGGMGVTIGYNMYVLYRYGHQSTVDFADFLCRRRYVSNDLLLLFAAGVTVTSDLFIHLPPFTRRLRLTLHNRVFSLSDISTRSRSHEYCSFVFILTQLLKSEKEI